MYYKTLLKRSREGFELNGNPQVTTVYDIPVWV